MRGFGDVEVQRPNGNIDGIEDVISGAFAEKTKEALNKKKSPKKKAKSG
jgi:hypothetical protein